MSKAIYKYAAEGPVFFSNAAKILTAQIQNNKIVLWAEVDTATEYNLYRYFRIIGTGQTVPDGAVYISTVQQDQFVWHVYEVV